MNNFTKHYLIAALWSSVDESDDSGGSPLDENYDISDLSKEALEQAEKDCAEFDAKAGSLLDSLDNEQAGHDFWLTRNRHGAGFWDRGLGELGDKLTNICHDFGECNLYVGDDNKLYFY